MAILPVVLFHANLGFPGGFVGVDVFFVISGFLITYIVQDEIDRNVFSLAAFWERRIRRLFPALAVVSVATLVAGWFLLLPIDFSELSQSLVAQTLLAANIYNWRESGYFAAASELKPMLHIWSLSVEEQFYVVLALLLPFLRNRTVRLWCLWSLLAASFGWCVYSTTHAPSAAFYLLPSRAWEMLAGVMLAQFQSRWTIGRKAAEILSGAGLLAIAASVAFYNNDTPFPGIAAALPCAGTVAILAAGNGSTLPLFSRLLSLKPLVFIGLISYPLYLWHWPLFAYANYLRFDTLSVPVRLALIAIGFGAAILSYRFVEQPFRRRVVCRSQRSAFALAGIGSVLFLAVGMAVYLNQGIRGRFSTEVLALSDARNDRNPQGKLRHDLPLRRIRQHGLPRLGDPADDRPPILAVIGDSHADAMMPVLDAMCREYDIPAVAISRSATLPLFCEESEPNGDKRSFQREIREQLESSSSVVHVLLAARWAKHPAETMSAENLQRTVDLLSKQGMTIWIVQQVPDQKVEIPRALALSAVWDRDVSAASYRQGEYMQQRSRTDDLFAALDPTNVSVLDPVRIFYPTSDSSEPCHVEHDGHPLYYDSHHLSTVGSERIRPTLVEMFKKIAADPSLASNR